MNSIQLSERQRGQMTALIGQLSTTRAVAEAFVGYFAKELGVNLQLYQFNADNLAFEPVQGYQSIPGEEEVVESYNGKIEAI